MKKKTGNEKKEIDEIKKKSMTAAKVTSLPQSTQSDLNESGSLGGDVQVLLQAVVLLYVMCVCCVCNNV
jgi:hypothetical protein